MFKGMREKEKKDLAKMGLIGSPSCSQERFINKLFDKLRVKSKEMNTVEGCDLNFNIREYIMAVGIIKSGGLNMMNEETAAKWYKIMNIDRDTKLERQIAEILRERKNKST